MGACGPDKKVFRGWSWSYSAKVTISPLEQLYVNPCFNKFWPPSRFVRLYFVWIVNKQWVFPWPFPIVQRSTFSLAKKKRPREDLLPGLSLSIFINMLSIFLSVLSLFVNKLNIFINMLPVQVDVMLCTRAHATLGKFVRWRLILSDKLIVWRLMALWKSTLQVHFGEKKTPIYLMKSFSVFKFSE